MVFYFRLDILRFIIQNKREYMELAVVTCTHLIKIVKIWIDM